MKAFADNKLYVTKKTIFVFDRVENIVRKGEITCTSNSSFSHNVFKRLPPKSRQKVLLCWKRFRKKTKPKFELYSVKRGLNVIAKRIDAHVIMSSPRRLTGAKLFASFKFSACRRTILHHDSLGCLSKWILWIHNKMISCLVKSMDESNTVVSAYTLYSYLQQCCFHQMSPFCQNMAHYYSLWAFSPVTKQHISRCYFRLVQAEGICRG